MEKSNSHDGSDSKLFMRLMNPLNNVIKTPLTLNKKVDYLLPVIKAMNSDMGF